MILDYTVLEIRTAVVNAAAATLAGIGVGPLRMSPRLAMFKVERTRTDTPPRNKEPKCACWDVRPLVCADQLDTTVKLKHFIFWKRTAIDGGVGFTLSLRYQLELPNKTALAQELCDHRQSST